MSDPGIDRVGVERLREAFAAAMVGDRHHAGRLARLPERERQVLALRFVADGPADLPAAPHPNLDRYVVRSLAVVGRYLGISGQRVRVIEARALQRYARSA